IDVSGSMVSHFPLVAGFVDTLRDYPIRIYSFDTRVRAVDPDIFSKGHITGGGGTDFNCVISDFIANDELAAALVFTDGYGELSEMTGKKLRMSRKNMYAVFLEEGDNNNTTSILKKFARDSLVIRVKDSYYMIKQEQIQWANS
ncbi:MAG: hypothetical protein IH593_05110, partial [Bacteroidales bacterium]|nr:hypothetical protein [Bacteroidales bacterium]